LLLKALLTYYIVNNYVINKRKNKTKQKTQYFFTVSNGTGLYMNIRI